MPDVTSSRLARLIHAYTSRRSPWGPPWWIYGVTFGAANVARQAAVLATPVEIPQPIRVGSWVATALVVIAVVNGVAVVLQRRGARDAVLARALAPLWPLRPLHQRHPSPEPVKEEATMNRPPPQRPTTTTTARWAPWWVYLVVIVGANYLRRAALPDGSTPALRVAVALVLSAALFVVITIVYRIAVRRDGPCTT
jgi:hypothetical protein